MLSPEKLVARLALTSTSQVLEVGAGSGFYSVEVARRVSDGHLELLDLQPSLKATNINGCLFDTFSVGLNNYQIPMVSAKRLHHRLCCWSPLATKTQTFKDS